MSINDEKVMNLLIISVRADYGGGPEHIYRLLTHLPENINTYIACPKDVPYWQRFIDIIGLTKILEIPHRRLSIQSILELKKWVSKSKIDLIHSHGKGAGIYGRILSVLTGIPCVHTFHGLHIGQYGLIKKRLYIFLEQLLSRVSAYLISVSKSEAQQIQKAGIGRFPQLRIIENGVIIPQSQPEKVCNKEQLNIISVSRFDYQKYTELVIPIAQSLQSFGYKERFRFIILGDGPGRPELKKLLDDKGFTDMIILVGPVANPEKYLKEAFCYLSTSRWEGMSLALLEAMAYGLPVIASRVTGNVDLVAHGNTGFLYGLESPEEAAQYLIQLAENPDMWRNISHKAKKEVAMHYNVSRMVQETVAIYELSLKDRIRNRRR